MASKILKNYEQFYIKLFTGMDTCGVDYQEVFFIIKILPIFQYKRYSSYFKKYMITMAKKANLENHDLEVLLSAYLGSIYDYWKRTHSLPHSNMEFAESLYKHILIDLSGHSYSYEEALRSVQTGHDPLSKEISPSSWYILTHLQYNTDLDKVVTLVNTAVEKQNTFFNQVSHCIDQPALVLLSALRKTLKSSGDSAYPNTTLAHIQEVYSDISIQQLARVFHFRYDEVRQEIVIPAEELDFFKALCFTLEMNLRGDLDGKRESIKNPVKNRS